MIGKPCPECSQTGFIRQTKESNMFKTVYRCDYVYPSGDHCTFVDKQDTGITTVGKVVGGGIGLIASVIAVAEWLDDD